MQRQWHTRVGERKVLALLVIGLYHLCASSARSFGVSLFNKVETKVSSVTLLDKRIERIPPSLKGKPLPPLETVVSAIQAGNKTAGQGCLDFVIAGHPKCGTTAMMDWFHGHPQLNIPALELTQFLEARTKPWDVVKEMYSASNSTDPNVLRGFKTPTGITHDYSMNRLRQYYPNTKLIVGIRHPVLMLESFYNYMVVAGGLEVPLEEIPYLNNGRATMRVFISQTEYMAHLSNLHKTNVSNDETEQALFPSWKLKEWKKKPSTVVPHHDVFLYDVDQLADIHKNMSRMEVFMEDLQNFLGLTIPFTPPEHIRAREWVGGKLKAEREKRKQNICDAKHSKTREQLVDIGRADKEWILKYFWNQPGVHISNRRHFQSILGTYDRDPCAWRKNVTK